MTTNMEAPYGRRRRPPKYSVADSFQAPIYKDSESVLIPRGFEKMEARFYHHARLNATIRRTTVIKVYK